MAFWVSWNPRDPLPVVIMISTIMIALPSAIKTFNWIGTMWGGRIQYNTVMLNCIAFVSMFIIGGLSGIFMAAVPVDIYIHDTYFIVAHFHYVIFGATLFGVFGGLLATNAFSAAYDVIRKENRGLGGALVNMTGGISSGVMIYMAGIWKETVGFAGMVVWMLVSILTYTSSKPSKVSNHSTNLREC